MEEWSLKRKCYFNTLVFAGKDVSIRKADVPISISHLFRNWFDASLISKQATAQLPLASRLLGLLPQAQLLSIISVICTICGIPETNALRLKYSVTAVNVFC